MKSKLNIKRGRWLRKSISTQIIHPFTHSCINHLSFDIPLFHNGARKAVGYCPCLQGIPSLPQTRGRHAHIRVKRQRDLHKEGVVHSTWEGVIWGQPIRKASKGEAVLKCVHGILGLFWWSEPRKGEEQHHRWRPLAQRPWNPIYTAVFHSHQGSRQDSQRAEGRWPGRK